MWPVIAVLVIVVVGGCSFYWYFQRQSAREVDFLREVGMDDQFEFALPSKEINEYQAKKAELHDRFHSGPSAPKPPDGLSDNEYELWWIRGMPEIVWQVSPPPL
mmetsp:Transcript_22881/g.58571  ORF Transcript_22881/g.58571 Transcript_22881/m.58571 type:complete len:104 (+) Transcript_22881:313-624(+)